MQSTQETERSVHYLNVPKLSSEELELMLEGDVYALQSSNTSIAGLENLRFESPVDYTQSIKIVGERETIVSQAMIAMAMLDACCLPGVSGGLFGASSFFGIGVFNFGYGSSYGLKPDVCCDKDKEEKKKKKKEECEDGEDCSDC